MPDVKDALEDVKLPEVTPLDAVPVQEESVGFCEVPQQIPLTRATP
jgi:hypothetical protein